MTAFVFIAHPVTGSDNARAVADVVLLLREALAEFGWVVRPDVVIDVDVARDRVHAGQGRVLVGHNVEQVASSAMLVLVVDHASPASSLWIEAGVALARGVATAVVASDGTSLPFLLSSALGQAPATLPPCCRIAADLFAGSPGERREAVQNVALELTSWAKTAGIRE